MRVLSIGKRLKIVLLDRLFPLEIREGKVFEFIKLLQGNMSVNEYAFKLHDCLCILLL